MPLLGHVDLLSALILLGAEKDKFMEINEYYKEIFFDNLSDIVLFDGVIDTLDAFKENNISLAITSNYSRLNLLPILESLEILDYFDQVVSISDMSLKRTSPKIVNTVLNGTKVSRQNALVVSDSDYDIRMGKNAKCKTCLIVYPDGKNININSEPDYITTSFEDVLKIVQIKSKSSQK